MPASAFNFPIKNATAGVGTTPNVTTSAPTEHKPAANAFSSISEEILVSLPIKIFGLILLSFVKTIAAARPIFIAISQVNSALATPLAPSVPNNLPI